MVGTMISKLIWVSRIVLKCEIELLALAYIYVLIKLKVIHIYIIILNYFAESKYMYIFAMQSGESPQSMLQHRSLKYLVKPAPPLSLVKFTAYL